MNLHSRYECVYRCLCVLIDNKDLFTFVTNTTAFILFQVIECEFLGLKINLLFQLLEVVDAIIIAIIIVVAATIIASRL